MDKSISRKRFSNDAIQACAQRLLAIGAPTTLSVAIVGPLAATYHGFLNLGPGYEGPKKLPEVVFLLDSTEIRTLRMKLHGSLRHHDTPVASHFVFSLSTGHEVSLFLESFHHIFPGILIECRSLSEMASKGISRLSLQDTLLFELLHRAIRPVSAHAETSTLILMMRRLTSQGGFRLNNEEMKLLDQILQRILPGKLAAAPRLAISGITCDRLERYLGLMPLQPYLRLKSYKST